MDSGHNHGIMTINLGALFLGMDAEADVVLILEHKFTGQGLRGLQAASMGEEWARLCPTATGAAVGQQHWPGGPRKYSEMGPLLAGYT